MAVVAASIGCSDVGGDNADADAAVTGGKGGAAGSGVGGAGGSQGGRAGSAGGSSDAASEARVDAGADGSADISGDTASDIRPDLSTDVTDVRPDLASDGAGGAGGADAADGAGGKSGAAGAGTGGAAGASGAGGASGSAGGSGAGGSAGAGTDASDSGGAGGSDDASADVGVDAPVDVGTGQDAVVINEGGRDAPTTTTEMILGAASADCLACAQEIATKGDPTCDLAQLRCETFTDLAQRLNCLDTLACVLPPGSAVSCVSIMAGTNTTPCYCGTVTTENCLAGNPDSGMYGVCKGYIDVGFPGKDGSFIGQNLSNTQYSSGRAMKLAQCLADVFNAPLDDRCGTCF